MSLRLPIKAQMSCGRQRPIQDSHLHLPGQEYKWKPTKYMFKCLKGINQANKLTKLFYSPMLKTTWKAGFKFRILRLWASLPDAVPLRASLWLPAHVQPPFPSHHTLWGPLHMHVSPQSAFPISVHLPKQLPFGHLWLWVHTLGPIMGIGLKISWGSLGSQVPRMRRRARALGWDKRTRPLGPKDSSPHEEMHGRCSLLKRRSKGSAPQF